MYTILNSSVKNSRSLSPHEENSKFQVRIHGVDGSLVTFTQEDPAVVEHIVGDCQRPDFFRQERIAVAGHHSVGMSVRDIVELPEQEFLYQVEARDFKHLERRRVRFAPGKPAVVYLAIQLVGGHHMYLKVQIVDVPRAERLQRIRACMELPGLSFRLAGGGLGLVNLTNAVKFTGYPGPAEVPASVWSADEGEGDEL